MDNQQVEATSTADGLVDGGADIVQEVREQTDAQYEQQADQPVEEAVDYSAPEVSVESETTPVNEWEVEARKFEPLGQLLEQRPDLVNMLQENINAPQQPQQQQQQGQPALKPEDFNPWDAYYSPESPSFKFRLNQEMQLAKDVVDNAMAQQKRQMQEEITYNNTVNELRNTYKFSDGDVQEFMGFVTQPKESVGLSNLVKLFRDVKNKGNAPETAQAVQNAQQQPRTAGVLQGGAPSSPKSTENQVWDNIVNAGSRTSVL
jgi:hypothetical protein